MTSITVVFGPVYLFWCLDDAGCIKKNVTYMIFHRALEVLLNKKIDYKKPQERYGMLKSRKNIPNRNKRIWNDVKRIEQKWLPLFSKML